MPDAFADSTALLKRLVGQIAKETDAVKYGQLAFKIGRVLEEREHLRIALALKQKLDQQSTAT